MCESGVNIDQLCTSIVRTEEILGVAQEWLEQLHHLADHAHKSDVSAELAQVTVVLGEARAKLERAVNTLGEADPKDDVTVELV